MHEPVRKPGPAGIEDESLLRAYRDGDVAAIKALVERYERPLYNFCLRMLGNRQAAEDAAQEAFLRMVKKASAFRGASSFRTWLYAIARNYCLDQIRRNAVRKAESVDEPAHSGQSTLLDRLENGGAGPERQAEQAQLRDTLMAALAQLPENLREVFILRESAGLTFGEIAGIVDANENTVKSRMRYALQNLRTQLEKAGYQGEAGQ